MATLKRVRRTGKTVYEVRWRDYDLGKHVSRTVSDAQLARQLKVHGTRVEERTRLTKDLGVRPKGDISLGYALDQWVSRKEKSWSRRTTQLRKSTINGIPRSLKDRKIRSISANEISDLLEDRAQNAPAMVIQTKTVLRGAFGWARKGGYLGADPMSDVEMPTGLARRTVRGTRKIDVKLVLSPDEVIWIANEIHEWHRTYVLLMGFSGLRPGEASQLRVEDIDIDARSIEVVRGSGDNDQTKTESSRRTVRISQYLADVLQRHIAERNLGPSDRLFSGVRGRTFNHRTFLRRHWHPTLARLTFDDPVKEAHRRSNGHSRLTPHDLRHTHASVLLKAGVNPAKVAEQLGHANAGVTLTIYAGYFKEDDDDVFEALETATKRLI